MRSTLTNFAVPLPTRPGTSSFILSATALAMKPSSTPRAVRVSRHLHLVPIGIGLD